ncbi:TMEM198/TM7SF3 family protein [Myxococcota bacterium]|nr:TMEM198/TM7SF3 family protein [Myxococcota bacterium]
MESVHPRALFSVLTNLIQNASQGNEAAFFPLMGAVLICGVVYAFFGYKVYRWVLALAGLAAGGALGYFLVDAVPVQAAQPERLQLAVSAIFAFVGLLIAPKLLRFFSFLLGGFAIGLAVHPVIPLIPKPYGWLVLLLTFAAGGFMALLLIRPTMILATSIAGSYLLAFCLFRMAIHYHALPERFNFLLFHVFWAILGVFALSSQLQQRSPALLEDR